MIRHALVIDQVERTGLALATFMRHAGIPRVDVTRSGHGFVEAVQRRRHDLLVVDIGTPEVTGLQMIDAVVEAGSSAALVLMSAQPPRILQAAQDYARARGARVLSAIAKPRTMVTMASAAQAMARERRHRAGLRCGSAPPANGAPAFTEAVLREALATRQIAAHFQPRHCARTGVLRGAELQPGWYRPDDTWLSAADFLPAIAQQGGAVKSGRAALFQAKQADGTPLPFGATVLDEKQEPIGIVGQGSKFIARGLQDKGLLTVKAGEGGAALCRIAYEMPVQEKGGKADGYVQVEANCDGVVR
ncbi:DNA-binding response OmpR family regulator [Variovorax boronicumulans]|uniref:FimD/PapC C-terminal domain-containing protein n=1 Tax=Variovorax boronicumulans TaxID=436515 RepID=UPI0027896ACE|nr:FimD/PapC C-terminal domain-containing protein [Variovorax boronicumulans]MDP9919368.1 DNA-binding response OmpR family regulator [Variovorax boronicumulans]